jgi:putative oxidoreductase
MNDAVDSSDGYRSVGGIRGLYANLSDGVTKWLFPLGLLVARIYLGWTIFKSGWARLMTWLDGKGSNEIFLFDNIHPVPGLPGSIIAPVTMVGELVLPILLVFGIFGRIGAGGILIMVMVIEFIAAQTPQGKENGIANLIHYVWMILALMLVLRGPGWLSLDHLLLRTEKR